MLKPRLPRLEKITGVVALSYLLLIPAALYAGYRTIEEIKADIDELYNRKRNDNPLVTAFRARTSRATPEE